MYLTDSNSNISNTASAQKMSSLLMFLAEMKADDHIMLQEMVVKAKRNIANQNRYHDGLVGKDIKTIITNS